ncbi:hypothetical protein CE143_05415 [Photorhabdus luminescens]|uniref:Uncharacterized protein n=1 Tax=Photorhabdus akhurstii TaxID=171438 RepID=A0ABX8LRX5_9GAMM|nr:hypothetical protein [Photorhabdus akhurstii]PQQ41998.1 hypothetical protein C6H65_05785 [Photorhabdus luminescens]QXF32675.1 hypothetical protein B0X70_05485 [Photorhabdus akhurstii]UJD74472.1 hypothetical protein CE143_05415 [Photorhabdus luminescens]
MSLTRIEAQYIYNNNLGCRYGTTTGGAAYAFMDIEGEGKDGGSMIPPNSVVMSWLRDPGQPAYEPRWHNRLWNSCGLIVTLSAAGTVLLVTKAPPTAERYLFDNEAARGDHYTFRKCNRLSPDSKTVATIHYGGGKREPEDGKIASPVDAALVDTATVGKLYNAILAELKKLAGSAVN